MHTRALRETSLLVDVLTPDHGVTRLVARGARSPRSRIRPLAQPFRPLLVSWRGAHELKTLTGIEEQGRSYTLDNIYLACAYYLNELLLRLLPADQPCTTVFARYAASLSELASARDSGIEIESILRCFELELLHSQGLLPEFAHCVRVESSREARNVADKRQGGIVLADQYYDFFPEQGYAIAVFDHADSLSPDTPDNKPRVTNKYIQGNGHLSPVVRVKGNSLLALAEQRFKDDSTRREAKQVMRALLSLHLGSRPLKTREMIAFYTQNQ